MCYSWYEESQRYFARESSNNDARHRQSRNSAWQDIDEEIFIRKGNILKAEKQVQFEI